MPISTPRIASPVAIPAKKPITIGATRKNPPAVGVRFIAAAVAAGRDMVNAALTTLGGSRETHLRLTPFAMDIPFITGRPALDAAAELIDRFGDDAGLEAAARAERSRDNDNLIGFCHWRQIERVIVALASNEVRGTLH